MNERTIGWGLVATQFALLAAIVVLSGGDDWPTPLAVDVAGWGLVAAGCAVAVLASRTLGSALTPTPEPRDHERLRTDGAYRFVRHPIYTGVLLAVAGWIARSGSLAVLVVGAVTLAFFGAKARWEERRLAAHYPDYVVYAARTGRFVPRVRASARRATPR